MNLRDTIQELDHAAKDMRLPDLRKLIFGFKPQPEEIQPYIHFAEDHYSRNLVYKTPDFEALVLCWRAGQRSPLHDHAKSICAVYVYDGLLCADNYRRLPSGHIRADYSEDFEPGSVMSIQTTEIHQVSNLHDSQHLISIHFYLPPLENNYVYSVMMPGYQAYRLGYTRVFFHADGI